MRPEKGADLDLFGCDSERSATHQQTVRRQHGYNMYKNEYQNDHLSITPP
jgi:hypothetical protein